MIATFSQSDVDLMKSWHMVMTPTVQMPNEVPSAPTPAVPNPQPMGQAVRMVGTMGQPVPKELQGQLQEILVLNAKILKAILDYPTSLPLEKLYPLAEKPLLMPAIKALNHGGIIHWSKTKEGFYINPRAKEMVAAIIEQAGI